MSLNEKIKKESSIKPVSKKKAREFSNTETRLRSLMSSSIDRAIKYRFPDKFDIIKSKVLFDGDVKALFKKMGWHNKSCDIYPLIESTYDTFIANLYDTLALPKVAARNRDDQEYARMGQDFIDWASDIGDVIEAETLARNEASLIGTSFMMASWNYSENKKKIMVLGEEIKTINKESQPSAEHVPYFELFYDTSAKDFYKLRWIARRKIMSYDECEHRYSILFEFEDRIKEEINSFDNRISAYDFTKIYDIKMYEHDFQKNCDGTDALQYTYDNVMQITKDNQLVEVIEYWHKDGLVIMINGRVYYDDLSPYEVNPFSVIVYEEQPGTIEGRGIGHKLMPLQKQANVYYNSIKDAIIKHVNPMYLIEDGVIIGANGRTPETITYVPDGVIRGAKGTSNIQNGGLKPIDFVNFNAIQLAMQDLALVLSRAQEIIGSNSYVQGGQGKVERSFGAANLKVNVLKSRLKPIINSLMKAKQHTFECWLSMASHFLDAETYVRVLGEDGYEFKKITPDNLTGKFDITLDVDAIRSATKSERVQSVVSTLQTILPYNNDPISGTPIVSWDSIIELVSGTLEFDGFKPMTKEERSTWLKDRIEIAQSAQQVTPPNPAPGNTGLPSSEPTNTAQPQDNILEQFMAGQQVPGLVQS